MRLHVNRVFALLAVCAVAQPVAGRDTSVKCDAVEKYTTEWFMQNTKAEFVNTGLRGSALFYSRGMSEVARALGRSNRDLVTIWVGLLSRVSTGKKADNEEDIWPCELYNHHDEPTNPLRCIHADEKQQLTYFENMSRAFALKARSFARVLHSAADYPKPPTDGIWGRIEERELKKSQLMDSLQKMSEDLSLSEVFWNRLQGVVAQLPSLPKLELKRDIEERGGQCMPEWEYKVFDKLPW